MNRAAKEAIKRSGIDLRAIRHDIKKRVRQANAFMDPPEPLFTRDPRDEQCGVLSAEERDFEVRRLMALPSPTPEQVASLQADMDKFFGPCTHAGHWVGD